MYLIPKVPKKDFSKLMANDRKVLRFGAKMDTTKPEDVDRWFILSYYLADDTISMYEPPRSNSGIAGGKFLERRRVENPSTGNYYTQNDFLVAASLEIYHHKFIITSADDYTRRYMGEGVLTDEAVKDLHEKIRPVLKQHDLNDLFQAADADESETISKDEFRQIIIDTCGCDLSDQEFDQLYNLYDPNHSGSIEYREFIHQLM